MDFKAFRQIVVSADPGVSAGSDDFQRLYKYVGIEWLLSVRSCLCLGLV